MPSNAAPGPELRLEVRRLENLPPLALEEADIAELRRSIRVVRCMVENRLATLKGQDAVDAAGRPVDPLADEAARFSLPGAFLRASRSGPSLYVTWMRLCNATAADLLDDPAVGVHAFADDPDTNAEALLDLLDEVEGRLDRLAPPH
jgi:hypothetical protein